MLSRKEFIKKAVEGSYNYKILHVIYNHKFNGIEDHQINLETADFGQIEFAYNVYSENKGILGFSSDFIYF